MSLKTQFTKHLGANRRYFDQDTPVFAPFEVIDVGNSRVAINEGVVIFGSSAISYDKVKFSGNVKPQNLMGGDIESTAFLTVKKNDFVVLLLSDNDSSQPKAEIKAVAPADLDKEAYKRKKNKVIKLAQIINEKSVEGIKYLDVQNLYASQIISETENWPAFTPIVWPVEKIVDDNAGGVQQPTTWKAIFIPGSLYLPQTMDECRVFNFNNVSMMSLPIVEVKAGDKFYVTYEIDKSWKVKNTPTFTKTPSDRKITKVVPEGPECESDSGSDGICTPKDGYFKLKVVEFEAKNGGLYPKIHFRSDIIIYGWERCQPYCDGDDSDSDGDPSASDSDGDTDPSSDDETDPSSDDSSDSSDDSSSSSGGPDCCVTPNITSLAMMGVGFGCPPGELRDCFELIDIAEDGVDLVTILVDTTIEALNDCSLCANGFTLKVCVEGATTPSGGCAGGGFIAPGSSRSDCFVARAAPCSSICATATVQNWNVSSLGSECDAKFDAFCPSTITKCTETPGICGIGCDTTPDPPGGG